MDQQQALLHLNEVLDRDSRNITRELYRRALQETCEYVEQNMFLVNSKFEDRYELLEYAIKEVKITDGLWLEFGVYKGNTINYIAEQINASIYGFDSFQGIPTDWRSEYKKGAFALEEIPQVTSNVELVIGYFQDTIPKFLETNKKTIAFAHIDCDLYSSAKTIFDLAGHKFSSGSIIVFDEYFNYPGWKNHEFKAFTEFIEKSGKEYEYIGYVYRHSQVAVRILS